LSRARLLAFFRKLPPTEIAMEACGAAYHWARQLIALGHTVRALRSNLHQVGRGDCFAALAMTGAARGGDS
jgi:transposase